MYIGGLHKYEIRTIDAFRFWSSSHKCNKLKAIIAFSKTYKEANENLRRAGYKNTFRKKVLASMQGIINDPDMADIPFSTGADSWWKCAFGKIDIGVYVKWKLTKDIDGHWGRAYFRNGDYIYIGQNGSIDGKTPLTPNHTYQYQGPGISGVTLTDVLKHLVDKGVYDSNVYNAHSATELEDFFIWFDQDRWQGVIHWDEE